jgi:hypothetical protein
MQYPPSSACPSLQSARSPRLINSLLAVQTNDWIDLSLLKHQAVAMVAIEPPFFFAISSTLPIIRLSISVSLPRIIALSILSLFSRFVDQSSYDLDSAPRAIGDHGMRPTPTSRQYGIISRSADPEVCSQLHLEQDSGKSNPHTFFTIEQIVAVLHRDKLCQPCLSAIFCRVWNSHAAI